MVEVVVEVSVIIGKCQHNTLGSVENAQESECCQRKDVFSCNANSINNTTVTEIKSSVMLQWMQ